MQKTQNLSTSPHLVITTALGKAKVILHQQALWKIGRGKDNDIPILDKSTSRYHALLQILGSDNFLLIDLGSSNGTLVNNRRVVKPTRLKSGDRITIGNVSIEFFAPAVGSSNDTTTSTAARTDISHKRRLITVLVVDIRNFTRMTQQLDENILSQMIGTWFSRSGSIISSYGSWMDKYIGDAIMSVWMHNSEVDDIVKEQMLQTLAAVRELFIMSNSMNQKFKLPFPLRIGAGINTGYAMIGQMGNSAHPDYTALGDTVNAAFRLESATKEINVDIALGQKTYQLLAKASTQLGFKQHLVNLKGYDRRITTFAGNLADLEQFLHHITFYGS